MKKNCILIIALISILTGCSDHKKAVQPNTIAVEPQKFTGKSFNPDSIFTNPRYIPLETNKACLIDDISKVIWYDDKFYILDMDGNKLFIFNADGTFYKSVGKRGNGPQEYSTANDIAICNQKLYLLARDLKKLMTYTLDGEYVSEIALDGYFTNMAFVDENNIILYRNFNSNSTCSNLCRLALKTGKLEANYHQVKKEQFGVSYRNTTFDLNGDDLYFFSEHDYNIYQIWNDSTVVQFRINFGLEHSLPDGSQYLPFEKLKDAENSHIVTGIDDLMIFEHKILFNYIYSGVSNLVVYDKDKHKILANGYLMSSLNFPYLDNTPVGKRGKQLITYTDAMSIINGLKFGSDEFKEARRKLKFTSSLKPEDNPVLVIVDLK